jgi:hypothetical protein
MLGTIEYARLEWEAWQEIVCQWPGDMSDPKWNSLVGAIRFWGERLAELRNEQRIEAAAAAV